MVQRYEQKPIESWEGFKPTSDAFSGIPLRYWLGVGARFFGRGETKRLRPAATVIQFGNFDRDSHDGEEVVALSIHLAEGIGVLVAPKHLLEEPHEPGPGRRNRLLEPSSVLQTLITNAGVLLKRREQEKIVLDATALSPQGIKNLHMALQSTQKNKLTRISVLVGLDAKSPEQPIPTYLKELSNLVSVITVPSVDGQKWPPACANAINAIVHSGEFFKRTRETKITHCDWTGNTAVPDGKRVEELPLQRGKIATVSEGITPFLIVRTENDPALGCDINHLVRIIHPHGTVVTLSQTDKPEQTMWDLFGKALKLPREVQIVATPSVGANTSLIVHTLSTGTPTLTQLATIFATDKLKRYRDHNAHEPVRKDSTGRGTASSAPERTRTELSVQVDRRRDIDGILLCPRLCDDKKGEAKTLAIRAQLGSKVEVVDVILPKNCTSLESDEAMSKILNATNRVLEERASKFGQQNTPVAICAPLTLASNLAPDMLPRRKIFPGANIIVVSSSVHERQEFIRALGDKARPHILLEGMTDSGFQDPKGFRMRFAKIGKSPQSPGITNGAYIPPKKTAAKTASDQTDPAQSQGPPGYAGPVC